MKTYKKTLVGSSKLKKLLWPYSLLDLEIMNLFSFFDEDKIGIVFSMDKLIEIII